MRIYVSLVLVAVAVGVAPAQAQDSASAEVTPYVAVGSAGISPIGAAVLVPLTSALGVEIEVGYRKGEGHIHALGTDASLLWSLRRTGQFRPFLAAGVGLFQYGTPILSPGDSAIGTERRLGLRVNAGGGLKMPLNENVALRTDARWLKSFGVRGSEQFRFAQGLAIKVGKR
jgi:hypothetical protein